MAHEIIAKVLLVFGLCGAFCCEAEQLPSDAYIRKHLVGSCVTAKSSPEYRGVPEKEVFSADGTYRFQVFKDATCLDAVFTIDVRWHVANGVLTSVYPNGSIGRDQVVSIDSDILALHSLETNSTTLRERSKGCLPQ